MVAWTFWYDHIGIPVASITAHIAAAGMAAAHLAAGSGRAAHLAVSRSQAAVGSGPAATRPTATRPGTNPMVRHVTALVPVAFRIPVRTPGSITTGDTPP